VKKVERVHNAVEGKATDHIPFSFWTHMAGYDMDPCQLAEKTYEFFKEYDVDIIKTMSNGMYSVEDFGCTLDQSQVKFGGVTKIASSPIDSPKDWNKIKAQDIHTGALARELQSLKFLLEKTKGDVPIVFTIMSPMTTAEKLTGGAVIDHLLDGHADDVLPALDAITETTCALADEAIKIGASGIFFASQIEFYGRKDEDFCLQFEKPYDLKVIKAASQGWCNILHAHGKEIMFDVLKNYPVQVFNWHIGESLPDPDELLELFPYSIMGGLDRMCVKENKRSQLHSQIYKIIKKSNGKRLIVSPGCVVRLPFNKSAIAYIKNTIHEMESICN
jgi:uroporphyrinogen decarboxylase